ncbi:Astacin-like metalloendopeptidase [Strongyloides ratti]|uniref:Metalloendopeptidase n=1 Tax=Strongyloides ratti TaxID=34506 RepID=A0A090KU36_STRRB|nr:Astacin-like metalloendopeptidase [Strongyloides ratti]CEF59375.1 Astacin-like metalloendopeptidase [Strongyloides ratti]
MIYHDIINNNLSFNRSKRAATSDKGRLWPNGLIPYEIDETFSGKHYKLFQMAMRLWMNLTCLTFIPKTDGSLLTKDYIYFTADECGCCSYVGKHMDGKQIISIGRKCDKFGIVLHEIGHTIGFWHEHTREDRDKYVDIFYSSIKDDQEYNFDKSKPGEIDSLGENYDYESIMHYSRNTFSRSIYLDTILPKHNINGKKPEIGQRTHLSIGDIRQTNKLYQCDTCFKTFYQRNGIISIKNERKCTFRILGAKGERIRIKIFPKNVLKENNEGKSDKWLTIRDGFHEKSKILGILKTNNLNNIEFISKENFMFIQFKNNSLIKNEFILGEYEFICGGKLTKRKGFIESPNFPELYPYNISCQWEIEVSKNMLVAIKILYIEIEKSGNCMYDNIEFYEESNGELLLRTCGSYNETISVVTKESNKMKIIFNSDASNNKNGFLLQYLTEENECKKKNDLCEHICINEIGGYSCQCHPGFSLSKDKRTCLNKCGGHLANLTGAIISPNFPNQYPPNTECTWDIILKDDYQIFLNFSFVSLEGIITDCSYDSILVYELDNNMSVNHSSIVQICGQHTQPLLMKSTANKIRIKFQSDSSVEKFGFIASYIGFHDECLLSNGGCEQICESNINSFKCKCLDGFSLSNDGYSCLEDACSFQLFDSKGSFASPNYPEGYPSDKECKWHFITTPGHTIELTFHEFDLEESSNCSYDNVSIYNTYESSIDELIGIYCYDNYNKEFSVSSNGNQMFLVMKTDSSIMHNGFKASYYSKCGGTLYVDNEVGYVYSHDKYGEGNYYPNSNCKWKLKMKDDSLIKDNIIKIKFIKFNLESSNNCDCDHVKIIEHKNSDDSGKIIDKFCGNKLPSIIMSRKEIVTIVFSSDDSMEGKGFVFEYQLTKVII